MATFSFRILTLSTDIEKVLTRYTTPSQAARYICDEQRETHSTINSLQIDRLGLQKQIDNRKVFDKRIRDANIDWQDLNIADF